VIRTDGFGKEILKPIDSLLVQGTRKVWIKGNHEHWENQLIEQNPELEGSIERDKLYNLREKGWEVYETGTGFDIGKLHVIHGETLKGTYHARNAVDSYAQSVCYGHFHTSQSYTKVLPQEKSDKWVGTACPCLCSTNPIYLRNAPTSWLNGFVVVEVQASGNFNLYPIVVTNGKFSFGGIEYEG
jgi:hypothetical protein